jgi:hypothetical protein
MKMKKLTLIMLVAMIPFFTMGQKRSKKSKAKTTNASYEFMIINGYAMMAPFPEDMSAEEISANGAELKAKLNINSRVLVAFDFGSNKNEEKLSLSERSYKSMADAVNAAEVYGWEFINANVVSEEDMKVHYYYMKRKN